MFGFRGKEKNKQQADREKFEQVYTTYRQLMYYVANSILHDTEAAEDAVQQAFIRIFQHLDQISQPECPQTKSFVVIIVRNIAINLYNSRKRRVVVSFDELEDWTADEALSPMAQTEEKDDCQRLIGLIESLPENYRAVLLLRYAQGYSTKEVSEILEISEENVKKRIQRARSKLEQLLEKEEVGP